MTTGEPVRIEVDAAAQGTSLRHVWSYYGYDECNYTTTPEAMDLMRRLVTINPEPVYLRTHFLLNSGDGTPSLKWGSTNAYTEDGQGRPVYDWRIMDGIMDTTVACGCRPLVEIGFMPRDLSVKPEPYQADDFGRVGAGASCPPRDYEKWAGLITEWVRHSRQRYPDMQRDWLWELWNEPNIRYWRGTFEEYCRLFDYTEQALHKAAPHATLGGPHTTGSPEWLQGFLTHCASGTNAATGRTGTRLDYVGFHSKGRTEFVNEHVRMDLGHNLQTTRDCFSAIAGCPAFAGKPVIIGECDPEGSAASSARVRPANGYRNGSAYAAYEIALMKHTLDLAERTGVNLQGVLTWAFLFADREYFEGFRTLSTNGIGKPVLGGFEMLGRLRGRRVPVKSAGALGVEHMISEKVRTEPDIDALATATDEGLQVITWNYHDDMVPAEATNVRIEVKAPAGKKRARLSHYRIDDEHSNAYTRWLTMGSPQSPTPEQLDQLDVASRLEMIEPLRTLTVNNDRLGVDFQLPRYGVSLLELRWE